MVWSASRLKPLLPDPEETGLPTRLLHTALLDGVTALDPALQGAFEVQDVLDPIVIEQRFGLPGAGAIDTVDEYTVIVA